MLLHSDPTKSAYENFREQFPIRVNEQGVSYRQNKVLLNSLMNGPKWLRDCINMTEMRMRVMDVIRNADGPYNVLGKSDEPFMSYRSERYRSDLCHGFIQEGDDAEMVNNIRYVVAGHVYGCSASKFISKLLKENPKTHDLPQQIVTFIAEWFQAEWTAYTTRLGRNQNYTLHIGDKEEDFKFIYSIPDTGSCMYRQGQHLFYLGVVGARAAWMTDKNGDAVCRCILFDAIDDRGKHYRYAERRYSKNGNYTLKRIMRNLLIQQGEIDLYKADDASYDDRDMIYDLDEVLHDDLELHIELDEMVLEKHDYVLSFQDTFTSLDTGDWYAYNYGDVDERLDTTDNRIPGYEHFGKNYDEYHDEYTTSDLVDVVHNGRHTCCAEDDLEDFVNIDGTWYHQEEDNVACCIECEKWFLTDYGYYSDITDEWYCCDACMNDAELAYKERNWAFSEYDDEYYEDEDDVVTIEDAYMDNGAMEFRHNTTAHVDSLYDFNLIQICGHKYVTAESVHSCISQYAEANL